MRARFVLAACAATVYGGLVIAQGGGGKHLNPLIEPSVAAGIWFNPFSGRLNPADLTAAFAKGAMTGLGS